MGKGSRKRPRDVSKETYDNNWDMAFRKEIFEPKKWEKLFGKGSGGDIAELLEAERVDRPSYDPGNEVATPSVEGGEE